MQINQSSSWIAKDRLRLALYWIAWVMAIALSVTLILFAGTS